MPESLKERPEIAGVSNIGQAFVGLILIALHVFLSFNPALSYLLLFLTFFCLEFTKLFSLGVDGQPSLTLFDQFNILLVIDGETVTFFFQNLCELHVFFRMTLMQRHVDLE